MLYLYYVMMNIEMYIHVLHLLLQCQSLPFQHMQGQNMNMPSPGPPGQSPSPGHAGPMPGNMHSTPPPPPYPGTSSMGHQGKNNDSCGNFTLSTDVHTHVCSGTFAIHLCNVKW